MKEIILNLDREVTIVNNGIKFKRTIRFEKIVFNKSRNIWTCYFHLPLINENANAVNCDPLGALLSAFYQAANLIRDSGFPNFKMYWQSEDDEAGFHYIKNETDQLYELD